MTETETEGHDVMGFQKELRELINYHSREGVSNTPDFILAEYLARCLAIFESAIQQRETWHGRDGRPTQKSVRRP